MSGFEEIVRNVMIDKSTLLANLLSIEIYFFSRRANENLMQHNFESINLSKKNSVTNYDDL